MNGCWASLTTIRLPCRFGSSATLLEQGGGVVHDQRHAHRGLLGDARPQARSAAVDRLDTGRFPGRADDGLDLRHRQLPAALADDQRLLDLFGVGTCEVVKDGRNDGAVDQPLTERLEVPVDAAVVLRSLARQAEHRLDQPGEGFLVWRKVVQGMHQLAAIEHLPGRAASEVAVAEA